MRNIHAENNHTGFPQSASSSCFLHNPVCSFLMLHTGNKWGICMLKTTTQDSPYLHPLLPSYTIQSAHFLSYTQEISEEYTCWNNHTGFPQSASSSCFLHNPVCSFLMLHTGNKWGIFLLKTTTQDSPNLHPLLPSYTIQSAHSLCYTQEISEEYACSKQPHRIPPICILFFLPTQSKLLISYPTHRK